MTLKDLKKYITESIINTLITEGWYDKSTTPYFSRSDTYYNLGRNPLAVDNGNHSNTDNITQPSTKDFNGERLDAEPIYLSDEKMRFYKIANFKNDNIKSTLDFFGNSADGEKSFRNTIDTIYGAANRNGRQVIFRTISSSNDNVRRNSIMKSFWEFSFDNGDNWYIVKPNAVQNMTQSKLKRKIN